MLQNITPSLVATLVGLLIIFLYKNKSEELRPRIGLTVFYQLTYVVLIFLPFQYDFLWIFESSMNWSGKLMAIAFSVGTCVLLKKNYNLQDFINISPDHKSLKKIFLVGGITVSGMCLLTFAFSNGKPLDIEKLAYQATMPGIDEELWRGIIIALILPLIKTSHFKMGHPVVWFTTLIFALGHSLYFESWNVGFAADAFILTGILGYILGWTILKSKSILPALILHNLINFSTNLLEMVVT